MKPTAMIEIFQDKYPLVGPLFWILSIQYYVTQIVVALAWSQPYSLSKNTISDLGNTACGVYGNNYVCSPLHSWMNASFIVLGISMVIGSTLIYREFRKGPWHKIGFSGMALAGVGTVIVGLFPENTIAIMHELGAALPFLLGNVALIILGSVLDIPRILKYYTILSGLIALIGLVFFETNVYLGFGIGGMERIVAYPQSIWLISFGVYMSRNHFKTRVR